jgi:hypothetical protein
MYENPQPSLVLRVQFHVPPRVVREAWSPAEKITGSADLLTTKSASRAGCDHTHTTAVVQTKDVIDSPSFWCLAG